MQNKFGNEIELLAPAGSLDRMRVALHFGADAVYLGGKEFGLRAKSQNFDNSELRTAVNEAHTFGKKIYVTVNIFAQNTDFPAVIEYAKFLDKIKVDAVIISDLGVLKIFHDHTNLEIHISTQANVTNKYTAKQYVDLGAKRIILARELPLADIKEIAEYINGSAIVEVFVHGAMCISYSGRCLLSNYMAGRNSNRGDCAQPCRYKYALMEEKRPNEYYPIGEDENGTYILNSRDLCLIDHLQELADAGVGSFKIEGRMKSEHYVGGVVNAYRRKMDSVPPSQVLPPLPKSAPIIGNDNSVGVFPVNAHHSLYTTELHKISHRPYTTGLALSNKETEHTASAGQIQTHEIIAVVCNDSRAFSENNEACNENNGVDAQSPESTQATITIIQKNKFAVGDKVEILSPNATFNKNFTIGEIMDTENNKLSVAQTPNAIYKIKCPFPLLPNDILRKKL
jgi:putative protease